MKKLIYIFIVLCMVFACGSNAMAQMDNVGTSAANFLKIGIGARAQGMGGAYVARADEVTALYWNPAGITNLRQRQIGFTQIDWITDVTMNFLGIVVPAGDIGSFGLAVTYLGMGDMKITNWEHPEGTGETFTSSDLCAGFTWARKLTDRFAVGVQAKYIQEKINNSSAAAFALDIGTQYKTGFKGITIGMALTNFGTKMTLRGDDLSIRHDPYPNEGSNPDDVWANLETVPWQLPTTMKIGASMNILNTNLFNLTGNFDFVDERDYDQMWFAGGEAAFMNNMLFLRGGVTPRYEDEMRSSFGAGMIHYFSDVYSISIDYAFQDLGRLEDANRFSLAITF